MPSVNKTPTLGLNQWQGNEYFKREDLVNDNALIDAAIKQDRVTLEQKADLVNGKVPSSQLPEISSRADGITITDTAGNFTSTNVEGALAELFQSANNGKTAIRTALSNKGVTVSLEDTFTLLASKITAQMCKFGGTAAVTDVLSGKTFINNSGEILTGTMANQGTKSASLNAGGTYTIPAGYHNGNGVISANSLSSQTSGTATAGNILNTYTAWVGGVKITGSMTNQGAVSQTLTTQGGSYAIPAGYHNGSGKVTANISNLVAENVKQGVNVGGVVGTYKGISKVTGTFMFTSGGQTKKITLGFKPKLLLLYIVVPGSSPMHWAACKVDTTNQYSINDLEAYGDGSRFNMFQSGFGVTAVLEVDGFSATIGTSTMAGSSHSCEYIAYTE